MKVIIDASNISSGGGLTHLSQILDAYNPNDYPEIKNLTVYSAQKTLSFIIDKPHLTKKTHKLLNMALPFRFIWQQLVLPKIATDYDVVFSPGGSISFLCKTPSVTLSQNLLPFEKSEFQRYPFFSKMRIKMFLLRHLQSMSFRYADGVIYLSQYAKNQIEKTTKQKKDSPIVPHGIEPRFFNPDRTFKRDFDTLSSCDILYVSTVDMYKHQWNVIRAVDICISKGMNINLKLIGSSEPNALKILKKSLNELESPNRQHYLGAVNFNELHQYYKAADLFIFASTCENLPNILIEAMASRLPILSSTYGPMPEVLSDAGLYFDPLLVDDLCHQIKKFYFDRSLRVELASKAFRKSKIYSWTTTSQMTMAYLLKIARRHS